MASHNCSHGHGHGPTTIHGHGPMHQPPLTNPSRSEETPPQPAALHFPPASSHHINIPGKPFPHPTPKKFSCLRVTVTLIAGLLLIATAVALPFSLLVIRKSPHFDVYSITFGKGNASVSSTSINVAVFAINPHKHVGMSLSKKHSDMRLSYGDVILGEGVFPGRYMPRMSMSVVRVSLKRRMSVEEMRGLGKGEEKGQVPLVLKFRAPIKFKVGFIKTWNFVAKVNCHVMVNDLTGKSTILSKQCRYEVHLR